MRQKVIVAILGLLCSVTLLACASNSKPKDPVILRPPPEIVEKLVYPTIDKEWLECSGKPLIGVVKQDTDIPYQDLEDAWADCSLKLGKVHDLVATWPKSQPEPMH